MTWISDGKPAGEDPAEETASAQVQAAAPKVDSTGLWPLVVAVIWAIAAVIVGLVFILGVNAEAYGGDAYTGIEAAIVAAVHAVGWVIIATGVLGLVIAGSKVTATK